MYNLSTALAICSILDNIEHHVETANLAVNKGERELVKAHTYKVSRGVKC